MRIGALQSQQDVGWNRHQFQPHKEQHHIVCHARQRETCQEQQECAGFLAGAAPPTATAATRGRRKHITCLNERQEPTQHEYHPADIDRKAVDCDRARDERSPTIWLAPSQRHGRCDSEHSPQPAAPKASKCAGHEDENRCGHQRDFGRQERKRFERCGHERHRDHRRHRGHGGHM